MSRTDPMTDRQRSYIMDLLEERNIDGDAVEGIKMTLAGDNTATAGNASRIIEMLLGRPRKPRPHSQTQESLPGEAIPEGRYAIEHEGKLKFYVVDKPVDGRWAGYTFLSVMASSEKFPIKNREARTEIFSIIGQDVQGAMLRYGQMIGRCGHCNRILTDEDSRARGIGPICAERMHW